jgi:hypothetical protein
MVGDRRPSYGCGLVFTTYQQYTRIAKLFLKPINNMREFGTVGRTYSKVTVQSAFHLQWYQ